MKNTIEAPYQSYLMDHAPIMLLVVKQDGTLIKINTYARQFLGDLPDPARIQDLIVDFNNSFDLEQLISNPEKKHLMSINTQSDLPKSFHFQFKPVNDQIIIFGHLDILDTQDLTLEILSISQELSNTTRELHKKNAQLQDALDHVKTLQGIIPICSHCHKIRNDEQIWDQLETYLSDHSDAKFSHGICPGCMKKHYPDFADDE